MYFKFRKFKYIRRIYTGHFLLRLGRVLLLILLISAFLFIQSLRKKHSRKQNHTKASLSRSVNDINNEEKILSKTRYGKIKEDTIIFVVLTDGYSKEFETFLFSLAKVKDIEQVLVIFSHYKYDENLSNAIEDIYFCRVLQLYYPHSKEYAKESPDLNQNTSKHDKIAQQTKSAHFLDLHGYVNDKKYHWWWTANQVFEKLKCTKRHTEVKIFIEIDFILTEDFIYTTTFMRIIAKSLPRCEFISMGDDFSLDDEDFADDVNTAQLTVWDPKIHGVVAFDITTWNIIAAHYDLYCSLKDTSVSHTIHYISTNRMDKTQFLVLISGTPRAYKIIPCKWFCNDFIYTNSDILNNIHAANEKNWFPPEMELQVDLEMQQTPIDSEDTTALADPDDRALCHNITVSKIKKSIMAINI